MHQLDEEIKQARAFRDKASVAALIGGFLIGMIVYVNVIVGILTGLGLMLVVGSLASQRFNSLKKIQNLKKR